MGWRKVTESQGPSANGRTGDDGCDLAMPKTACATTATATTFRPWTAPDWAAPAHRVTPNAKGMGARADGSVKPAHAPQAPNQPARRSPSVIPTWLLAGPASN